MGGNQQRIHFWKFSGKKKKSKHVSGMSGENPSLEGMWLVAVKKGLRHLHANY